jgi:hypothetical protein
MTTKSTNKSILAEAALLRKEDLSNVPFGYKALGMIVSAGVAGRFVQNNPILLHDHKYATAAVLVTAVFVGAEAATYIKGRMLRKKASEEAFKGF